ncbi:PREDICTED: glycoprotein Xg isoform X1 [Gekko japonicus]|uniref:Glycoprotein Xg isoform X1 n=1 Tax=Gekko japonicus TaxID=146911 RepID=A0ABM1L7R9_GEKJA|nr:PREDICTED: glycoprotein Xg isoform X1 [Gekko japonicus]
MAKLTVALLCTGCFLLHVSGQDFDLLDALDSVTKKPPGGNRPKPLYPTLRPPPGGHGNRDDYFDLEDALGGNGNDDHPKPQPYPRPPPRPGSHGDSGSFTDLDLNDGKPLPPRAPDGNEHISTNGGNTADATKTAQITSPVVSIVVLCAVGGLVAYNAYKKKRYCFKPTGDTAA